MVFQIDSEESVMHYVQFVMTLIIHTKDLLRLNQSYAMIDFRKYLNCPECKKTPPYCVEHRKEVNAILDRT